MKTATELFKTCEVREFLKQNGFNDFRHMDEWEIADAILKLKNDPYSKLEEIKNLFSEMREIIEDPCDWDIKYVLIFSDAISKRMIELTGLQYYDPDSSCEDDVMAFYNAVKDKLGEQ
jgi:hypothetical protein